MAFLTLLCSWPAFKEQSTVRQTNKKKDKLNASIFLIY